MYLYFEVNSRTPFNIIFRKIIYQFETQGFKILTLETVQKSKLKQTEKKKVITIWRQLGRTKKAFQINSIYDFEIHFKIIPTFKSQTTIMRFCFLHFRNYMLGTPSTLHGSHMTGNQDLINF